MIMQASTKKKPSELDHYADNLVLATNIEIKDLLQVIYWPHTYLLQKKFMAIHIKQNSH